MIRFSVIIPTYNRKALLERTLATVRAQNESDLQVIVIDDGSTDGSVQWLRTLENPPEILTQANRGPGAARNLGIAHAAGDYIAFLDSDDLWFPWTLATYRVVIDSNGSPAFVAGCPFRFTDDAALAGVSAASGAATLSGGMAASGGTAPSGITTPSGAAALSNGAFAEPCVETFADYYASGDQWRWFGVSSFVIRRDAIVAAGGFTDDAVNGEDADLAMKLGVAPGFVQIKSPATFGYRDHASNVTADQSKNARGVEMMLAHERDGVYPGGAARRRERWRIIGRHGRSCSVNCLRAGQTAAAWRMYRALAPWSLREGRWPYVLGFPAIGVKTALSRKRTPTPIHGTPA
jgi:GT2 family glycosyltransferase